MNLKSKKVILNDEAYFFVKSMNDYNEKTKIEDNYEKEIIEYIIFYFFFSFLQLNYSIMPLDKISPFIEHLNSYSITPEEKLKIINFKPKSMLELDLVRFIYLFNINLVNS